MALQVDHKPLFDALGCVNAQQLMHVHAGTRPACRLRVGRDQLRPVLAMTEELQLNAVVGFDAIILKPVAGRVGYFHQCERAPVEPINRGATYVYFSRDLDTAQALRRFDETDDHEAVGRILGYPDCCINSFCEPPNAVQTTDPVLARYADGRVIRWEVNVSLMCYDVSILSHIPCSECCATSLALARSLYEHLLTIDYARAEITKDLLSGHVIHSEVLGVAAIDSIRRDSNIFEIRGIKRSGPDSILGKILKVGTELESLPLGIRVDNRVYTRPGISLFEFR